MARTGWAVGVVAAAAAALLAGTAGTTIAAGGASARGDPGVNNDEKGVRTVTVTVKEVDPKNHTVTFQATVKPEATTSPGRTVQLDQLREGDQIRASYDPKTGEVVRVDVTPGHPKAKTH